ncbi:hypothetical protein GCM10023199_34340 [Actinomycetospora chibensis]
MLRSFTGFASSRIAATLLQAITLVVIARALAPTEFAVFSATLGALLLFQAFADLGCGTAIARFHNDSGQVLAILRLGRDVAVASAVTAFVGLFIAARLLDSLILIQLLPLAVWVAAERQVEVRTVYLVSWNRIVRGSIALVGRRALVLVAVLVAGVVEVNSVEVFAISSAASSIAALIFLGARIGSFAVGDGVAHQSRAEVLRTVMPFWMNGIAQQVRQLDLVVLGAAGGLQAATSFAPASRLVPPLRILPTTYAQLVLARLSREGRPLGRRDVLPVVILAVPFYLLLAAAAYFLLPVVLGAGYGSSSMPTAIAIGSLSLAAISSVLNSGVQVITPTHAASIAWVVASLHLASIGLLGYLIGANGAALAGAIAFLVQIILLLLTLNSPRLTEVQAVH